MEIASGKLTKVDTDYAIELSRDISWSADSKWIAFARLLPNRQHAIFVYGLDSGKSTQITDGMSDARYPAFDRDGQYLYFTASTNFGPTSSGLDMTSDEHDVTRSVYLAVLPNNIPSPMAPESDEEKAPGEAASEPAAGGGRGGGRAGAGGAAANTPPKPVRIDFDKLPERIIALPVPARAYQSLAAGKAGTIYLVESGAAGGGRGAGGGGAALSKFDLKTRKQESLASGVGSFDLSANGEKMLLRLGGGGGGRGRGGAAGEAAGPQYVIVSANAPVKPGEGALRLTNVEVHVDPLAEWKQMYHEVWRIERSYFYDSNLHGVNVADAEKEYEKYLDSLSSRNDLNYLLHDMLGEMTVGHLRGGGGHIPTAPAVPGGLLGADFDLANGRYRIRKIYSGESWNPQLQGPLAAPGLSVSEGDYLLSIDGQELTDKDDISRLLENTSGKRVACRRGPVGRQRARDHGDPHRQRAAVALPGVGGGQPSKSGPIERRQAGLRAHARYRAGRTHQLHPLLLLPGGQAGGHRRRAVQLRRAGGRLCDQRLEPPADGLVESAVWRHLSHSGGCHPGAEGDDHQ